MLFFVKRSLSKLCLMLLIPTTAHKNEGKTTMNLKINNNKIKGNKKAICSLSLILMLAITLMMAFAQPTLAQFGIPQPVKTAGYISVAPQLVGVGQQATVNLWVFPTPQDYAQNPVFQGYSGVTVTFIKPDGSKDSFAPVDGTGQYIAGETEAIGDLYFFYAPDMAGNWSVTFSMPAQNITDNSGTVIYSACNSSTAYFAVQTDPVNAGLLNGYPYSQLPNSNVYWSYPINSNNREWSAISGDWLMSGQSRSSHVTASVNTNSWQPYSSPVNSAHIVWNQQLGLGGLSRWRVWQYQLRNFSGWFARCYSHCRQSIHQYSQCWSVSMHRYSNWKNPV